MLTIFKPEELFLFEAEIERGVLELRDNSETISGKAKTVTNDRKATKQMEGPTYQFPLEDH